MKFTVHGPAVTRGALVRFPAQWVARPQLERELSISNGAYWTAVQSGAPTEGIPAKLRLWREDGPDLLVPRHYTPRYIGEGLRRYVRQGSRPFSLERPHPRSDAGLKHVITLRDSVQEEASQALHATTMDKILALACGKGKTVVALHAALEGQRLPLLVVVHTNALMDQWRERINEFWPGASVGRIQQDECTWKGYPVAIAMLHTLVRRKFSPQFYAYWKLAVFDEVHRLGAGHFSSVCSMFPCERWGLSATLRREDGMDKVIQLHLGQVAFQDLTQPLKPRVYFVSTGIRVNERKYMFRRGRINLSRLMSDLADRDDRNRLILEWVHKAASAGRTILVLGERLSQLHYLYENTECASKSLHVGSMKPEERRDALKHQVVFATQHLAKEGLDRPAFDTLFILFPFGGQGRAQQSVGRILRVHGGKKSPRVFVFEDSIGILQALAHKLRRHLKAMDFSVGNVDRGSSGMEKS